MKKSILTWCCLIASVATLQAAPVTLDPIVVTATRTETALSKVASSVTVITAEEIERQQKKRVVDVLRSVPGVNLVQTGNTGGAVSIYLRGTDTKHTLVLIDGIEFRDVAGFGGANLSNLTTDNIKQIEIVRGAQSVLYGSDAIGGVINIITKKGTAGPKGHISVEGGSYNTFKENAGFSFGGEKTQASFSVSRTDLDGYSTANKNDGNNEEDGYNNTTVLLNIGAQPTEIFDLNIILRSTEAEYDYDASTYDFTTGTYVPTDADNVEEVSEKVARLEGSFHLLDNAWTLTVGTSVSDFKRTYNEETADSKYNGRLTKFDIQSTYVVNDHHTFVTGAETENSDFDYSYNDTTFPAFPYYDASEGSNRTNSVYAQDQITFGHFSTTVGVRLDDNEDFGKETTWRIAPTYQFEKTGTRIRGSAGTGFKAPTLYQLYSTYGNQNLDAETSFSWDAGVEQSLFNNSVIINLTYYHNNIDDYIDFDSATSSYGNIKELKTQGIESTVDWYFSEYISVNLGYTYTNSKDSEGERKVRIPLHKGTLGIDLSPIDNLKFNTNIIYASQREDANETLGEYTLVNVATSYQVNDQFEIFGRIDNLFDEDYEEVAGYGTAGLSAYAGVKFSF